MATETHNAIEIAKPGRAVAISGQALDFTPEILGGIARSYDPAVFAAQICIGHPQLNSPSFGEIGRVEWDASAERLKAIPAEVDREFAEAVHRKLYKSVSMSVYTPDSPSNPKPGEWYLRHVGFLGAQPPAIKGLNRAGIQFAADEAGVLEFGDCWPTHNILSGVLRLFRGLRDQLLADQGQETADRVLPGVELDYLNQSLAAAQARELHDDAPAALPGYAESTAHGAETMSQSTDKPAEFAEREAALAAQKAELDARAAALKAKEDEQRRAGIASFAEGLVKAGKILPRDRAGLIEFMAGLDEGQTLEFGEGDEARRTTEPGWFRQFLLSLPAQVDFSERGGGADEPGANRSDKAVADRARAYHAKMAERGVHLSFAEAVDAVHKGLDS